MSYRLYTTTIIVLLLFTMCGLATAQTGAEVYGIRCANCHGADGAGKASAAKTFNGIPDLRAAATQSKTDAQLFESIARGIDHKKYPHVFLQTGVTQNQLAEIVVYVRKLAKK